MSLQRKEIISNLIETYEKKGFVNPKSDINGYEDPLKLEFSWSRRGYTPDFTIDDKDGKRYYFVIEEKYNKEILSELIQKWILFSSETNKHGGKFYIVIPKEKLVEKIQTILKDKKIGAEIITPEELA
tara:strand:+ start:271 stop:654 length:384 start_codon:yes stop_codon:yes gene_type:complete